jgi:hypothetical protein
MKKMIILFSLLLTLSSCSEDDKEQVQENSIIGSWQLIERFDGGSPNPIQEVQNGKIISFNSEMIYTDNSIDCDGIYSLENSIINIDIPCLDITFSYNFSFENEFLLLTDNPSNCDEGCYDKYKKI